MGRQQVSFEWQVAEDDASWETMTLDPATFMEALPAKAQPQGADVDRRVVLYLLRSIAICLAGIALVAGVGLTPQEHERLRATAGIQAVLAQETQAAAQIEIAAQGTALGQSSQGGAIRPAQHPGTLAETLAEFGIALVRVEPIGELVLAEVIVGQPDLGQSDLGRRETSPYRETRFYRETEHGWRQTRPDPTFWGNHLHRETEHLRFVYFARDAATVEPLMAQLEGIYLLLHRMLGLEPATVRAKLMIEITPERVTGRGIDNDRLRVTSPIMAQVPSEFAADTFLAHQIVSRMVTEVISSNTTAQMLGLSSAESFSFRWRGMRRGLRSWLQTELLAQPWPWDRQATNLFLRLHRDHPPLNLRDVTWGTEQQLTDDERLMWQSAAAESVVAYITATYGQERLPDLLRGLHQYSDWEELIATFFDMSVTEFEAGWNGYLTKQARSVTADVPVSSARP